jgi:hypothetical protein
MPNLCALQDVKSWLTMGASPTSDDTLITNLVGAVSLDFLNEIKRPDFYPAQNYNEVREGDGGDLMVLRHWPVNSILNVSLISNASPPAMTGSSIQQASESYTLGTGSPPLGSSVAVSNAASFMHDGPDGAESSLKAVVNVSTGLPLAFVSQGTLQAGQYSVNPSTGVYAFSAADAAAQIQVTITYTWFDVGDLLPIPESTNDVQPGWWIDSDVDPERRYELYLDGKVYVFIDQAEYSISYNAGYATVPADAAQAVIEWTAERYKGRQWIGQTSKHMVTGESVSTPESEIPASVKRVIERYRRYDPLQTPPERVPLMDMTKRIDWAKARKK